MPYTKKKRSTLWHIEQILNDVAMCHKKIIRKVRKWLNLTDYKLLWLSFGEGLLLGIVLVVLIG